MACRFADTLPSNVLQQVQIFDQFTFTCRMLFSYKKFSTIV
jgi:hypothetical protein